MNISNLKISNTNVDEELNAEAKKQIEERLLFRLIPNIERKEEGQSIIFGLPEKRHIYAIDQWERVLNERKATLVDLKERYDLGYQLNIVNNVAERGDADFRLELSFLELLDDLGIILNVSVINDPALIVRKEAKLERNQNGTKIEA